MVDRTIGVSGSFEIDMVYFGLEVRDSTEEQRWHRLAEVIYATISFAFMRTSTKCTDTVNTAGFCPASPNAESNVGLTELVPQTNEVTGAALIMTSSGGPRYHDRDP